MDAIQHSNLWIFFALSFGVIALPGLDMAFVAGSALTAGTRGGMLAVAGVVAGGFVHVLVNVTGLAALLMIWPGAFNALLLAGAAYMAWIGWSMVRAPAAEPLAVVQAPQDSRERGSTFFLRGLLNCLLNPKAYAFMLAVFPGFLRTPERGVGEQALLLSAITAGNQVAIYGLVVLAAAGAQRWAGPGASAQRWISVGAGVSLLVAAVFTLAGAWQG